MRSPVIKTTQAHIITHLGEAGIATERDVTALYSHPILGSPMPVRRTLPA